jgi:hypothetical protein
MPGRLSWFFYPTEKRTFQSQRFEGSVSRRLIWGETAYVSAGLTELTKHRKALSFHAVSFGPHNDSLRQIVNIATQVQNSAPHNPAQPAVPCSYAEALDTVSGLPGVGSFFSDNLSRCNLLRHSSGSQNPCASREALSFADSPTSHASPLYRKFLGPHHVNQTVYLFNLSLVLYGRRKAGIEYNVEIRHVECQIAEQIVRSVLHIHSKNVYKHCQHMCIISASRVRSHVASRTHTLGKTLSMKVIVWQSSYRHMTTAFDLFRGGLAT